ncbi:MAG: methyltransferase family protein [Lysobacteraceae bacterium]
MSSSPTRLDAKLPPPLVMLACGAAAWIAARLLPALAIDIPARMPLAIAVAVVALAIELAAAALFFRRRTTVNPLKPETATHLVVAGPNRFSRNPMYVGQALLLAAWALWLAHALAPLGAVTFVLYITRFQILPEEHALAARFGDDWRAYRARVRRWL